MRSKIVSLAALASVLYAAAAYAQGGTGRSLDIQPGARQNGMGAAGVALVGDPTGNTWWNPAALGFTEIKALQITYAQLVPDLAPDVSYNYGNFVQPIGGWGAYGLGMIFLSYGTSTRTDIDGHEQGEFTSYEFSPAVYYGTRILPDLAVGTSVKWILVHLAEQSDHGVGSTFGLDLAALYRIPKARLSFGMNIQNLGPSITFINEDLASPLSRNIKAGAAWAPVQNKAFSLTLVSDFNQSLVSGFEKLRTYNHGLELNYSSLVAGRIGWYSDPTGDISDLTYGFGFNWNNLSLDVGSIPQATGLEHVEKLALGYRF